MSQETPDTENEPNLELSGLQREQAGRSLGSQAIRSAEQIQNFDVGEYITQIRFSVMEQSKKNSGGVSIPKSPIYEQKGAEWATTIAYEHSDDLTNLGVKVIRARDKSFGSPLKYTEDPEGNFTIQEDDYVKDIVSTELAEIDGSLAVYDATKFNSKPQSFVNSVRSEVLDPLLTDLRQHLQVVASISKHFQSSDQLESLPSQLRDDVFAVIFKDWLECAELQLSSGYSLFLNHAQQKTSKAILKRGMSELLAAYEEYPEFRKEDITKTFLANTNDFPDILASRRLSASLKPKTQVDKTSVQSPDNKVEKKRFLTKNEKFMESRIEKLHKQPGFGWYSIYDLESDHFLANIQDDLAKDELNVRKSHGEPTHNVWDSSVFASVLSELKPNNFAGKLVNPKMYKLDISPEERESFSSEAAEEEIDIESLRRYRLSLDMKSTGRGIIGSSELDVLTYCRNISDPAKRKYVITVIGHAKGDDIASNLNKIASSNGRKLESHAAANPLSGGLPSLGRRK